MVSPNLDKLNIRYDDEADVLYIAFGEPRPAIGVEVTAGDVVRIDAASGEIVGITIIDFKDRYMQSPSQDIERSARIVIPQILDRYK